MVVLLLLAAFQAVCADEAIVSGYARNFVADHRLVGATIMILEEGRNITTDEHGRFNFSYTVGKDVTLSLYMRGQYPTQTPTVTVPPEGLVGPHQELTFQVPTMATFDFLEAVLPVTADPTKCQFVVTVTTKNCTLDCHPQGEPGATISLVPAPPSLGDPFYFGIIDGKTNPFVRHLRNTSRDGGAMFFNVDPSPTPYTLSAHKDGEKFTSTKLTCRPGVLVNGAPPRGPIVL